MGNVTHGKVRRKSLVETSGSISPNSVSILANSVRISPNGVRIFPNGGAFCLNSLENLAEQAIGRCCSYYGSAKWRPVATDNCLHFSWFSANVAGVARFFALYYAHARARMHSPTLCGDRTSANGGLQLSYPPVMGLSALESFAIQRGFTRQAGLCSDFILRYLLRDGLPR